MQMRVMTSFLICFINFANYKAFSFTNNFTIKFTIFLRDAEMKAFF